MIIEKINMKKEKLTIDPQYLINKAGKKTAVVLDMKTFENILEYVEDDYFGKQAANILLEDDEVLNFRQVNKKTLQAKKVSKK
jgi:hypothetical protein